MRPNALGMQSRVVLWRALGAGPPAKNPGARPTGAQRVGEPGPQQWAFSVGAEICIGECVRK